MTLARDPAEEGNRRTAAPFVEAWYHPESSTPSSVCRRTAEYVSSGGSEDERS
jgi:hypothetical protein